MLAKLKEVAIALSGKALEGRSQFVPHSVYLALANLCSAAVEE
jgi:hypothetical protein